MDFRAALTKNTGDNMKLYLPPHHTNGAVRISAPIGNKNVSEEATTRRRRRRRNKLSIEPSIESQHVFQEHTPPYTPLRAEFGELPTLQVQQASPEPKVLWPPSETPQRIPLETLKAFAERARERLAIRILAYQQEQQKVAEAASHIQNAYANHMESQLKFIVTAIQGDLSTAIDTKLDAFKQAWQEEISGTLQDHSSSHNPHEVDPRLVKAARISALESETQKLMEMVSTKKETLPSEVITGDMLDILQKLQAQGERADQSIRELHASSKLHALETKELRDAMRTAGLLPAIANASTPQKIRAYGDLGSAKGKYPFSFAEGKENSSSSPLGLSNSPMKSYQSAAGMADSPQL